MRSIRIASRNAAPSALTLRLKSSLPSNPNNARADQMVLKAKEASLAGATLLTVVSIRSFDLDQFSSVHGLNRYVSVKELAENQAAHCVGVGSRSD